MVDIGELQEILEKHGYQMQEQIGSGGFSFCFKVLSTHYKENFAIKIIDLSSQKASTRTASYMNEITSLTHLSHPNIIELFEYFTEKQYLFIVLEYCPGGDLLSYIQNNGPLVPNLLSTFIKIIGDALRFIHMKGYAHLDFKPSNILLDKNGRPKIADFGLSQHFDPGEPCHEFLGSPAFTSPEIVKHQNFDPFKADVWAFGVTIYFIATGIYPFNPKNIINLRNEICCCSYQIPLSVSPIARTVINTALIENPLERPTIDALMEIFNKKVQSEIGHSNTNTALPKLKPITLPLGMKAITSPICSAATNRKTTRIPRTLTRSVSSKKALGDDAFSKYLGNIQFISHP